VSKLLLKLEKYIEGPQGPPVSVEILNAQLETVQRSVFHLSQPHLSQTQETADLPPGHYLIQMYLPSGEIVRKHATVEEGITPSEPIGFQPSESPREWLSYQHFLGNVEAERSVIPKKVRDSTWLRMWKRRGGGSPSPEGKEFPGGWEAVRWPWYRLNKLNKDECSVVGQVEVKPSTLYMVQIGGKHVPSRLIGYPPVSGPVQILIRGTDKNKDLNGGIIVRLASFDAKIESLLGYLARGYVESAAELASDINGHTTST
jgi:hypothetical protein